MKQPKNVPVKYTYGGESLRSAKQRAALSASLWMSHLVPETADNTCPPYKILLLNGVYSNYIHPPQKSFPRTEF